MELDHKGSPTSESSSRNITNDEKQKENCAANQFFSSLLGNRVTNWSVKAHDGAAKLLGSVESRGPGSVKKGTGSNPILSWNIWSTPSS
jgi:hypothetical protein